MQFSGPPKSDFRTSQLGVWACLFLLVPQISWAVATPSGTTISNQTTVTYVIGTDPPSTTASNTASFQVDKKVNLVVAEVSGSAASVNIGQSGAVATFTVTNLGNDPQGFDLAAALASGNPATGGAAPFTTNNFGATGLQVFVDSNANSIYDAGVDTAASIPTLAAGVSQKVFIVGSIPATALNGQQSVVSLTAAAVAPTTMAALLATVGGDTPGVDVVFADSPGVAAGDIARDAKHSAYAAYLAKGVSVALTKSVASVVDPNGTAVLMPGAVMTYQIAVVLSGTGTATNLVIADPLPSETTYLPGSIIVTGATNPISQFITTTQTVSISLGNVAAPANIFITFRATIN
jgi:uncharacterized repeat protein (TIGR01451 family)